MGMKPCAIYVLRQRDPPNSDAYTLGVIVCFKKIPVIRANRV